MNYDSYPVLRCVLGNISHKAERALLSSSEVCEELHQFLCQKPLRFFHEMNLKMFKMFTDKGFQDVSGTCSSEKVSI